MFFRGVPPRIYLATGCTDMRKSINGLSILVAEQLELDPLSGQFFCFCNRKRSIIKILYWKRNGFCLWLKKLEKERFKWPQSVEDVVLLERRELFWLLDGLSVTQVDAHKQLNYTTMI